MERHYTIFSFFSEACAQYSNKIAFIERKKYRRKIWTYQAVKNAVAQVSEFLKQKNLKKEDKVIICMPNSPYWATLFFACAVRGIILVPLDANSSPEFIEKIALLTEAKYIFFSKNLPQVTSNYSVTKFFVEDFPSELAKIPIKDLGIYASIQPDDILEIAFSSGSTGEPKGVILTHKNVCSDLYSLAQVAPLSADRKFLSIIPLSHMFEQTAGLLSTLLWGASTVYLYSIKPRNILEGLREENITSVICVPAFLQILKNNIVHQIEQSGQLTSFEKTLVVASRLPQFFKRLVFLNLRARLGRRLKEFYVGGAPLDNSLEIFWNNLGITVLQGYGMTETSPLIAGNSHKAHRLHSVGKTLPDETVKLSPDGEILVKGPNVSKGYYKNPEAAQNSFEDGWLKTGDIGKFDNDGFLFIKGRKKNTIIGPSGMKIYSEDIEKALREYANVKEAAVFGIEKASGVLITAAVVPNDRSLTSQNIIAKANQHLASHQKLEQVVIWPDEDFPRTPTKKIIRDQVLNHIKNGQIDTAKQTGQTSGNIINPIIKIISEITGASSNEISSEANFVTDLHLDSIKRLELASRIEEELNIELDESNITHKSTVADLEKLITNAQHSQKTSAIPNWPNFKPITYIRLTLQQILFALLKVAQDMNIKGQENLNVHQPVILIANHQSHLDAPDIVKALPVSIRERVSIAAAKDYFFGNKISAFFTQLLFNTFPLDREGNIRESLSIIGKLLDKGLSVLIFPEGTRTLTGKVQQFKNGIGVIAQEMEVPVIPIKISGNFEILPKGKSLPKYGVTEVTIGKQIIFSSESSYIQITEKLQDIVESL